MSYELAAIAMQNSIGLSNGHFVTEVECAEELRHGAELYVWRPESAREVYEQAERDYHRHNPTLDGQS